MPLVAESRILSRVESLSPLIPVMWVSYSRPESLYTLETIEFFLGFSIGCDGWCGQRCGSLIANMHHVGDIDRFIACKVLGENSFAVQGLVRCERETIEITQDTTGSRCTPTDSLTSYAGMYHALLTCVRSCAAIVTAPFGNLAAKTYGPSAVALTARG
jgi:hypothetical protein